MPCLLAVPSIWKLLGPASVLPFHPNSLFFMFWISCLFPGNLSAPASRLGTSLPLCGTPFIPVALWCNYIADSLEQVSQLLHDWLFFFFFNIPKTWCLILSEASDTWLTWPLLTFVLLEQSASRLGSQWWPLPGFSTLALLTFGPDNSLRVGKCHCNHHIGCSASSL